MQKEIRNCQNCKTEFAIEPDDFAFYEKIGVPPPTWCPQCRLKRRLNFINCRALYKRVCGLCKRNIVAMYSPEDSRPVYCPECWFSDKWDAMEYGKEYDAQIPFLKQLNELDKLVPHISLSVDHASLVNCEYVNFNGHAKDCYLTFIADFCENVLYSSILGNDKDCMDCTMLESGELCYGDIDCGRCSRTFFSEDCADCTEVYFSKDCRGCNNCFGCMGLRKKDYYFFNEPLSKDEYFKRLKEFDLSSRKELDVVQEKVLEFWLTRPHRYAHLGNRNVNVTGDYVYFASKNSKDLYYAIGVEDSRFCQLMTLGPTKDCYDITSWGNNLQRSIEAVSAGEGADSVRYTLQAWPGVLNVEYSMWAISSSNIFGCAGVRKKQYCILNKQYSKESFDKLRIKIIEQMNTMPYVDAKGRIYRYGEFFPMEMSPHAYNESDAMDYFPLTKDKALEEGFSWRDADANQYIPTMGAVDIPDSIVNVSDDIAKEIISCSDCGKAYRIIPAELLLLRRFNIAAPRLCPNCRHRKRQERINPPRLWKRSCAKCGGEMMTSYSPDRPEIIYCESCYQAEVA